MDKIASDEKWFLDPEGICSLKIKKNKLVTGNYKGVVMIYHWPLKSRSKTTQQSRFQLSNQKISASLKPSTLTLNYHRPRMINSFIINEDRLDFINDVDINDTKIAMACGDHYARLYDLKTNNLLQKHFGMKSWHSTALSQDYWAFAGNEDCAILNAKTYEPIFGGQEFFDKYYLTLLKIYQNKWIIGSSFGKIIIFDILSGDLIFEFDLRTDPQSYWDQETYIDFYEDILITNGEGNFVFLWDLRSGNLISRFQGPPGLILSVSVWKDIAAVCNHIGQIYLWNTSTNTQIADLKTTLGGSAKIIIRDFYLIAQNLIMDVWNLKKLG